MRGESKRGAEYILFTRIWYDIEQAIGKMSQELEGQLIQALTDQAAQEWEVTGKICPECQGSMRNKGKKERARDRHRINYHLARMLLL